MVQFDGAIGTIYALSVVEIIALTLVLIDESKV